MSAAPSPPQSYVAPSEHALRVQEAVAWLCERQPVGALAHLAVLWREGEQPQLVAKATLIAGYRDADLAQLAGSIGRPVHPHQVRVVLESEAGVSVAALPVYLPRRRRSLATWPDDEIAERIIAASAAPKGQ